MTKDSWSIGNPGQVEDAGRKVTVRQLKEGIHFVRSWRELIGVIEQYKEAGAEAIVLISEADKLKIREFAKNLLDVF
jgi:hypothetical protein